MTIYDNEISTSEGEANSSLIELDRGLRSQQNGEQCEAIIKFLQFFDKYPFPIFINSAYLKLTDVFRDGSNFMRHLIYVVFQQSQKHVDKILNIDELLKRIFVLSHSNDSIARSVTLKVLGSISNIIADRTNVQHFIQNSMESHDKVEVESAIMAAERFCEKSNSFSVLMCDKITKMIEGLSTPLEIKLKIIPLYQYMYRDIIAYEKATKTCIDVLSTHPTQEFTILTLGTLTKLSMKSSVDVSKHVDLLLLYLADDLRSIVKLRCLKDLVSLTRGDQTNGNRDNFMIDKIVPYANNDMKYCEANLMSNKSYLNNDGDKIIFNWTHERIVILSHIFDSSYNILPQNLSKSFPNSSITTLGHILYLFHSILKSQVVKTSMNLYNNNNEVKDINNVRLTCMKLLERLDIISIANFNPKVSNMYNQRIYRNVMRKFLGKLYLSKQILNLCTEIYIGGIKMAEGVYKYWLFTTLEHFAEEIFDLHDHLLTLNDISFNAELSLNMDIDNSNQSTEVHLSKNQRTDYYTKYQMATHKLILSCTHAFCRCVEEICTYDNGARDNETDVSGEAVHYFSKTLFTLIQRSFTLMDSIKALLLARQSSALLNGSFVRATQLFVPLAKSFSKLLRRHSLCNVPTPTIALENIGMDKDGGLAHLEHNPQGSFKKYLRYLVKRFEKGLVRAPFEVANGEDGSENLNHPESAVVVVLSKLIFHLVRYCDSTMIKRAQVETGETVSQWTLYMITVQAMRHSHHSCASNLLSSLRYKASTGHLYYWLHALHKVALSEAELAPLSKMDDDEFTSKAYARLNKSLQLHHEALRHLNTSSRNFPYNANLRSTSVPLAFQIKYSELRARTLRIHLEIFKALLNFYLCPIDVSEIDTFTSSSMSMAPHESFITKIKVGKYRNRLTDIEADLSKLVTDYTHFYTTRCFDCDHVTCHTVANDCIARLKLLLYGLRRTFAFELGADGAGGYEGDIASLTERSSDLSTLYRTHCCDGSSDCKNSVPRNGSQNGSATSGTEIGVEELDDDRIWRPFWGLFVGTLKLSNPYPPFYFKSVQSTHIKLAISPQPRHHGGSSSAPAGGGLTFGPSNSTSFNPVDTSTYVTANLNTLFNVSVEGVIQHMGARREFFRSVSLVKIECGYEPITPSSGAGGGANTPNIEQANAGGTTSSHDLLASLYAQIPFMKGPTESSFTKDVHPKNDYFSSQFLFEFPAAGFYTIKIKCGIVDNAHEFWESGPESTLNVKVI